MNMKTQITNTAAKFALLLALFIIAASAVSAAGTLDPATTFTIVPEKAFVLNDVGYLNLHVISDTNLNFSANIVRISGITNLSGVTVPLTTTGNCDATSTCRYDQLFSFNVLGVTEVIQYRVTITAQETGSNETRIITVTNPVNGTDADLDGFYSITTGGNDCDDNNAGINPGASEVCGDGLDNDCNAGDVSCPPAASGGSSGGGGGSSGGGSTSGVLSGNGLSCGSIELEKVEKDDQIIVPFNGINYTFFVRDILPTSTKLKLYPIPSRDFSLKAGESVSIDLDMNNRDDLILTVKNATQGKASFGCKLLATDMDPLKVEKKTIIEQIPETIETIAENIKEGVLKIASDIIPKKGASPVIGSLIALAIITAGLLIYFILRKGKDEDNYDF